MRGRRYDPVTTITAYVAGHKDRLDREEFYDRLRDLLAEYGAADSLIISIEESEV